MEASASDAARAFAVVGGGRGGGGAAGRGGRRGAADLSHRRLRPRLEVRGQRPAEQHGARGARRSGESQSGIRRARDWRLRFVQRRRRVAIVATESAGGFLPRSRDRAERPDRGHLRTRAMGDRRYQPAARTRGRRPPGRRRRDCVSVRARGRGAHAVGHVHGYAVGSRHRPPRRIRPTARSSTTT